MNASSKFICIFLLQLAQIILCKVIGDPNENGAKTGKSKLVFAHPLCRHGDRNIYRSYPNDPYQSKEYWPRGFKELTNRGMEQHYLQGQFLRQRYSTLLENGEYSPDSVYVFSTDTGRTLSSAQAHLAGLFPPTGDQVWNKDLNWQPIPIHTVSFEEDYLLHVTKQCDRFEYEITNYLNESERFDKLLERYWHVIEVIKEKSGTELWKIMDLVIFYDTLAVERSKGLQLPDWAEEIMNNGELGELILTWYPVNASTTALQKLKTGFLLKEILDHFTDKLQSTLDPDLSLWMYFGHDFALVNILKSLGLYWPHFPPYASCLLFELYQTEDGDGDGYVQIFYKNSTESDLQPMKIPNCDIECPLPKMYELFADILPTDSYDIECKLPEGKTLSPDGVPTRRNF